MTRLLCCALSALAVPAARANYADDTGYNRLKAELGAALPDGTGVGMSQVEATPVTGAYMPEAGAGTFSGSGYWTGKLFTARSGTALFSDHAYYVGAHMYGSNTDAALSWSTMTPGVVDVDCYDATNWYDGVLAPLPLRLAPLAEIRAVQNHSWVYSASAANLTGVRDMVRREDFAVNRDNFVCCVGLNNGSLTEMPDVFAAAYNVISVGVSSGEHSRGTTTTDMDGPGRRKPELVAPLEATSFSTAWVSTGAGLLRQKADIINTTNARRTKTLKAVLLAGASKDPFPAWAKAAAHPIDSVYGAGEVNIYNSYHILNGGEQPANNLTGRPAMAWDYHSLSASGTADYRLNIPAGMYGVELSAFIVWHKTLTNTAAATGGFVLAPDALINFDFTLLRDPAAGGGAVTIDSSASTLYNMEHVWKRNLPAGNYRLRVSRGTGGVSHDFAIAWRLTMAPHAPPPVLAVSGGNFNFSFPGVLEGQPYKFQSSPELQNWTDIRSFTGSAAVVETHVIPAPAEPRYFYRLLPVLP